MQNQINQNQTQETMILKNLQSTVDVVETCNECHCPTLVNKMIEGNMHWTRQECDCEREMNRLQIAYQILRNYNMQAIGMSKERMIKEIVHLSGLTGKEKGNTFVNFEKRPGTEKAYEIALSYIENFEIHKNNGEGIVFIGPYGNGKSHLAAAITNHLVLSGYAVKYQPVSELLKEIKSTYGSQKQEKNESSIFKILHAVHLLILDDIGAYKQTEWVEEQLYNVIDGRYRKNLPTIITTNCSGLEGEKSLSEALGARSVDRLIERNVIVKLTADSYRRELARKRLESINI